ncbi:MAG: alpha-amylase/4-alpha-glucanotransferase domain-containing protein [Pseudomonadota bacterium]
MIDLGLVLHCHQPVGNFDSVFETAHDRCYRPLLELLDRHPGFKCGLHFSGCLLEWLEIHRRETVDLLAELVRRDQAEPLSGGFYEPLLASIPRADALGQVRLMNDFIADRFGRRPTGFWLTERIWDPGLPLVLDGSGLEYTLVDDTHLFYAGLDENGVFEPHVTEREGKILKILAAPMVMRYLIPFYKVDEVMGHLRHWNDQGRTTALYGDDGEKFGLWPGTYEWVIEKGWLETFFKTVADNGDWLRPTTPEHLLKSAGPLGRIYLPPAGYEEMTRWALPTKGSQALEDLIQVLKNENRWDAWRPFIRGGTWDNFLVKYEESNRMHKKALHLSGRAQGSPEASRHVWRAQCNCAYWHGVFGGLYMGHLRRAVHENLIRASQALPRVPPGEPRVLITDIDKDGRDEILLETDRLTVGLEPARGGGIFDLSFLPLNLNLADVLTRRPEPYHRRVREAVFAEPGRLAPEGLTKAKEKDLDLVLAYDPYPRASLLDHFFETLPAPGDLAAGRTAEYGDLARTPYEVVRALAQRGRAIAELTATRSLPGRQVTVRKTIAAGGRPDLTVDYQVESAGDQAADLFFGVELALTVYSDQDHQRYFYAPEFDRRREPYETGAEYRIQRFDLVNGGDGLRLALSFSRPVDVLFFPLYTVSLSEDGFEKNYQGTSLLLALPLARDGQKTSALKIDFDFEQL